MGTRFRKSKTIGGVKLTASKSGLSASVGGKHTRLTKTASGDLRGTVHGGGLSYSERLGGSGRSRSGRSSGAGTDTGEEYDRLEGIVIQTPRCDKCGAEVPLGSAYCPECGAKRIEKKHFPVKGLVKWLVIAALVLACLWAVGAVVRGVSAYSSRVEADYAAKQAAEAVVGEK